MKYFRSGADPCLYGPLLTGYTVFETLSPTGILSRALIYGPGLALLWVLALLLFEVFVSRRAWCRYVCPIGMTYGLVGLISPLEVKYDVKARHAFFKLLAQKKDAAMLISSHRLDEVASLVNRVIEMDQGNVVLDDEVADLVDMASRLHCRITLTQPEAAFAKAICGWGFQTEDQGLSWQGHVAGPDRLRFLGVLSRYAALLAGIHMEEEEISNANC